jgi:hypothetical protein
MASLVIEQFNFDVTNAGLQTVISAPTLQRTNVVDCNIRRFNGGVHSEIINRYVPRVVGWSRNNNSNGIIIIIVIIIIIIIIPVLLVSGGLTKWGKKSTYLRKDLAMSG